MHTPEEARGLWCPMVRIARHEVINAVTPGVGTIVVCHEEHHVVGGNNRDALGGGNIRSSASDQHAPLASCRCIADKCALWRWDMTSKSEPKANITPSGRTYTTYEQVQTKTHGYCGLAPLAQAA